MDTKEPCIRHFCTQINDVPIILTSLRSERIIFHCIEKSTLKLLLDELALTVVISEGFNDYLLSQRKQSSQLGNYRKNGGEPETRFNLIVYMDHRNIF